MEFLLPSVRINLSLPTLPDVDRQKLARTENSAFIAIDDLSSTPGMPSLVSGRAIHSSQGADNFFTPGQDSGPLFNAVADSLSRNLISRNSVSRNSISQNKF